jgi:hypothetical protein
MEPAFLVSGLCLACAPQTRRFHAKEEMTALALKNAGFVCVRDRMLEDASCGRERPDFQIDFGSFFVYVECDENAHRHITPECEEVRMKNLAEVRGMPVVFVRFNPDTYTPAPGQLYVPCGQARYDKLVDVVTYLSRQTADRLPGVLNVVWLFYDNYDKGVDRVPAIPSVPAAPPRRKRSRCADDAVQQSSPPPCKLVCITSRARI